jgi:hypothetical protein
LIGHQNELKVHIVQHANFEIHRGDLVRARQ